MTATPAPSWKWWVCGALLLATMLNYMDRQTLSLTATQLKTEINLHDGRYGALECTENQVNRFVEKPRGDGGFINGGFFVLSPKCLDLIEGDRSSWEGEPLSELARMGQMMAFKHHGFWQPMDTLRDKNQLEELWVAGKAPWKRW